MMSDECGLDSETEKDELHVLEQTPGCGVEFEGVVGDDCVRGEERSYKMLLRRES